MTKNAKYRLIGLEGQNINTTQGAIEATGLDWNVDSGALQGSVFNPTTHSREWRNLPNHKVVYRTDTGLPLGNSIVGQKFELVQNKKAFRCFDEILQDQKAIFTAGGWFHDGASVFLQARLPEEVSFDNQDTLQKYLMISQGHTGQQALSLRFTHVRISCSNTLYAALRDSRYSFSMKHTESINERIDEAIGYMKAGLNHLDQVEEKFSVMTNFGLSKQAQLNYLKMCYDRPLNSDMKDWKKWKNIEPIYSEPKGFDKMKPDSLWRVYNSVTEFEDHHAPVNKPQGRETALSPSEISQARQVKALFAENIISRKTKAFSLANEVISGRLDLTTGERRNKPANWSNESVRNAAGISTQGLLI